ncbi:WxL domain-containing protein [Enterococcus quebecensis]|uniref:WxL domain-containing protein n=1 Tax=Enterococcus quebecensis TaxID=903983 RepID=A0A1E5GS98_9ENTE|nr:WxL domain-containing protein [Enterococcus quebecensis]OEG15552.1 hypothetical protein BCR23_08795 [Enterococcus quebecensis]OJG74664.1 hypothetical protein RV12_GL002419 [Enterococcus quebecensis]
MKHTHTLSGAALLAVLGVALAVPTATKAEANPWASKGSVEFDKDTSDSGDITVPDTDTDITITEPTPNTEDKDMKINAATDLDFDKHTDLYDGKAKEYKAKKFSTTNKENDEVIEMQHFVRFQDYRATTDHKYTVSAAMTSPFTNNGMVLEQASIIYNNLRTLTSKKDANQDLIPVGTATGAVTLTSDGASQTFVTNTDPKKGFGQFDLLFGTNETAEDSVKLSIPAGVTIAKGVYTADITWTIADVPAAE